MLKRMNGIVLVMAFVLPIVSGCGDEFLRENYVKDAYYRTLMSHVCFIANIAWLVLLYAVWLRAGLKAAANKYRFVVFYHFIYVPLFLVAWIVYVFFAAFYIGEMNGIQ